MVLTMSLISKCTCPEGLCCAKEPRRGAVAPPDALMDHCCPSSELALLLAMTPALTPPMLARLPGTPDLLSILDLQQMCGYQRSRTAKKSLLICLHRRVLSHRLACLPVTRHVLAAFVGSC